MQENIVVERKWQGAQLAEMIVYYLQYSAKPLLSFIAVDYAQSGRHSHTHAR